MRTEVNNLELKEAIAELVERHGGVRAAARVLKISGAYLSRLNRGEKIWPDDKVLKKLGVRRTVIYWRLK